MVVLIVEDEFLINVVTSDDLRSAGYEVVSVYNADEAIEILESTEAASILFSPTSTCLDQ